MQIAVACSYEAMSEIAAQEILKTVRKKPQSVLALAAGSTPVLVYEKLGRFHAEKECDFSKITTFQIDEYIGLSTDDKRSFFQFFQKYLFHKITLPLHKIHTPRGMAEDIALECQRYHEEIVMSGGIDLLVLGIGSNGHIGFNEPDDFFTAKTHAVELSEATRRANSRFFKDLDDTPKWAISMGIEEMMHAKKIMLLASGTGKASALAEALTRDITPKIPASILQFHQDVLVIADEAAAMRLSADIITERII